MTDQRTPEVTAVGPTSYDPFKARDVADKLVGSVEGRINSKLGTFAGVSYRAGKVSGSPSGGKVSVFLGGDTSASPNFRVPSGMTLSNNDSVIVVINPAGDRWVGWKF